MFEVVYAEVIHAELLAPLFDQYRVFLGQTGNLPESRHFIFERLLNHESVVFMAQTAEGQTIGFAQLYPVFSSARLQSQWNLSGLYVLPEYRRQGVATALVNAVIQLAQSRGDGGLVLEITQSNTIAGQFYEKLGFQPNTAALPYALHFE